MKSVVLARAIAVEGRSMKYSSKSQAQLECRINTRKLGGLWIPVKITGGYWQPQRVDSHDQRVRRTMYVK